MLCHSNENRRGRRGEAEEAMHQAFQTLAIHSCNTGLHWIWFLSRHSNIACDIRFTIMPRTLWVSPHPLLICTRLPICVLQALRACQCTRSTKFPTQTTAPCWLLAKRGNTEIHNQNWPHPPWDSIDMLIGCHSNGSYVTPEFYFSSR